MSTTNFVKPFRGRTTVYWVTTLLLALECLVGGIMGALQRPTFIDIMKHLGYPDYVMTIIGVWYVLGGVALLVPGFPLLKEWAYAGLFFIYTGGAIASRLAVGLAVGDGVVTLVGPIILTGLVIASWTWRPSTRRLDDSI
jgi:DoxX-like family